MKSQPVWIYSGALDSVVVPDVLDKTMEFYTKYTSTEMIQYINWQQAEHTFPTDLKRNKNACAYIGPPYISDCGFDAAGSILSHIMPGVPLI